MKQSDAHKNLMNALENKNFNVFRRILKDNPECINEVTDKGSTALITAAAQGVSALVEELVKCQADLNIKNNRGYTALIAAAYNGYTACVDILVAAGADLTLKDNDGTALENAIKNGREDCIEILLKAKSPIKGLSDKFIEKHASLIEKHYPETWAQVKKEIEKKAEKERIKESFQAYSMVNDFIVLKCEGDVPTLGKIHTMFNFRARTVTEIIDKNPGTPREFDGINPKDMDEISMAYDFTVWKGKENFPPTKKPKVVKIPS